MSALLDITKVVGTIEEHGASFEVCAEAKASYDPNTSRVIVNLHSYLRSVTQSNLGRIESPNWLPRPETLQEHVDLEEATELAKDVFASWSHKVHSSIPLH